MYNLVLNILDADGSYLIQAESDLAGESEGLIVKSKIFKDYWRNILSLSKSLDEAGLETIGRYLFDVVFKDTVRDVYYTSLALARDRSSCLRILLKLDQVPLLHKIPWELLHDAKGFLALNPMTPLARYLKATGRPIDLQIEPPIRILFTANTSSSHGELDIDSEEKILRKKFADLGELAEFESAKQLSVDGFRELWLRRQDEGRPFQIWHHGGHGVVKTQKGRREARLLFTINGKDQEVSAARLKNILQINQDLRLVVINACYSTSFSGLATEMARLNVPATVGFSGIFGDSSALSFVEDFYEAVLSFNKPLEVALNDARLSITTKYRRFDWMQPVILIRTMASSVFSKAIHETLVGQRQESSTEQSHLPGKLLAFGKRRS